MEPGQVIAAVLLSLLLTTIIAAIGRWVIDELLEFNRSRKVAASAQRTDRLVSAYDPEAPPPDLEQDDKRRYRGLARQRRTVVSRLAALRDYDDRKAYDEDAIPFLSRWLTRRRIHQLEARRATLESHLSHLSQSARHPASVHDRQ